MTPRTQSLYIYPHTSALNMKSEYDLYNMKSRKNPNSKEIEYTDEPIGDVKIISDFLPSPAELTAKPKRDRSEERRVGKEC